MRWRRLASGLLTLSAVQFAVLGGSPCSTAPSPERPVAEQAGHAHHAPADEAPCESGRHSDHGHHRGLDCLAMAGCTGSAPVVVTGVAPLPLAPSDVEFRAEVAGPHSYTTPPETPPPIA